MFKDLKVTLYDFFGYFLPGTILLIALIILFWTIYFPGNPITTIKLSTGVWTGLFFIAYFLGHIIHALANILEKFILDYNKLIKYVDKSSPLSKKIINAAESKISTLLNLEKEQISTKWLFRICDESLVQNGNTEDREMYEYRKGFYRGLSISFLLLSIILLLRALISKAKIQINECPKEIGFTILLFFILFSCISCWFSYNRYIRFTSYRIVHAILGFLTIKEGKTKEDDEDKEQYFQIGKAIIDKLISKREKSNNSNKKEN